MRLANINSWEWNIQDSTLKLYKTGAENALNKIEPKLGQQETTIENFPAQVLKSRFLEAASKENFARYIREIKDGYNGKINKSELAIKTPPGNTVWLEVGSETIRDEEGNALKAIGYYTDITEERTKF